MSRRRRPTSLPAPYLKRIWLDQSLVPNAGAYPFCLPLFDGEFELAFDLLLTDPRAFVDAALEQEDGEA